MSGGFTPTGNVTFRLFGAGTRPAAAGSVFTSPNVPLSGGSATSTSFMTTAAGTYQWVATFNGNANNTAVSSVCGAEPVTVGKAAPTIATTPSAGGPGRHVHLGHGDGEAAGSPRRATSPSTCSPPTSTNCTRDPGVHLPERSADGGSATSGAFPTTAVGTYQWTATYNGDTNNAAVTSGCTAEPVVITQAAPTIATTPSAGGPVGTSISDTPR